MIKSDFKITMRLLAVCFILACTATRMQAQSKYDLQSPFGWANCSSLTSGDDYQTVGGGAWNMRDIAKIRRETATNGKKVVVLQTDGSDMSKTIQTAIKDNDIVVLDGSKGDFIIGTSMKLHDVKNRTLIGINDARLCSKFYLSEDIHKLMNDNKVLERSTSAAKEAFVLPNGAKVKEECEYTIRKLLIEKLDDEAENFRHSGILQLVGCENIILRNLSFVGPGAIDVGGDDLLTITNGTRHAWIDHCTFTDGMDGNCDITNRSDFITVSWCVFRYTDRTYVHANTNLVGSNDNPEQNGADNLNVTYAYNRWGEKCNQRMPMVRFGTVHVLNNFYDCPGNAAAVNPRHESEVLVEGNLFNKGVKKIFKVNDAKAYVLKDNTYLEKFSQPADLGTVSVPYQYPLIPTLLVMTEVGNNAGVMK